jgi:tetratricopeptide (TPR) repeat protein
MKDIEQAIADYSKAIALEPEIAVPYYNSRGQAYAAKQEYAQAISDYNQSIRLKPSEVTAYIYRGIAYYLSDDFSGAISDFDQAIKLDPKNANAYFDRGLSYYFKNELNDAIADFDQAITLDDKNVNAYINRGLSYYRKNDLNNTIADFNQAITLDPKSVSAYWARGNVYLDSRDYDKAIADFGKLIEVADKAQDRELAYLQHGKAFYANDDYEDAIADFNKAEELCRQDVCSDDDKVSLHSSRGNALYAKDDYEHAIADYTEVIKIDPKGVSAPWAYYSRGRLELYTGELSKARNDLDQARELNPKDAYTALWLDIANKRSNLPSQLSDAVTQIDMTKWPAPVISLYRGSLTAVDVLAAAKAADVKTTNDQVCEANFFTGELALLQGAKEEATRLFKLAAADCPKRFVEWPAANAELKALGQSP